MTLESKIKPMRMNGEEVIFYTCKYCNKTEFLPKKNYELPDEVIQGYRFDLRVSCIENKGYSELSFGRTSNLIRGIPSTVYKVESE